MQSSYKAASGKTKRTALTNLLLPILPFAWLVFEIVLLVEVGKVIGGLGVALLLIGSALAGGLLLRHAGTSVLTGILQPKPEDRSPIERLRKAGWQVVAGILLIMPGLASDVVALLLLLPPVRHWLSRRLPTAPRSRTVIIEGEYHDVTPPEPRLPRQDIPPGSSL